MVRQTIAAPPRLAALRLAVHTRSLLRAGLGEQLTETAVEPEPQ
ncbi:MAG: hypothetical protein ACRDTJ_08905 [Pseudonocardiaceae bacterium]